MTTKEYLSLDIEKDKDKIIEFNKSLIARYPFLMPRNVWTDKIPEDYDYTYTLADDLPRGWRLAFGDQLFEELKEELIKYDYLDKYRINTIKEKYGSLRLYDNGYPAGKLSDDFEIVDVKYNDEFPHYNYSAEILKEIGRDNYVEPNDESDFTNPEYKEKNKDCIIHYEKRRIIEPCKIPDIIHKHEMLSADVCIKCGKPHPEYISKGWISYYCEDCAKEIAEKNNCSIEDYFEKENDNEEC